MTDLFDTLPEILRLPQIVETLDSMGIDDFETENPDAMPAREDDILTVTWWRAQDIGRKIGLPDRDTRRICAELAKADCGMVCKTYSGRSRHAGTWWLNELAIFPFASMALTPKNKLVAD
jgi:hypothetical protein